jgi:DNA-binding transcriptional ArsR family regulator
VAVDGGRVPEIRRPNAQIDAALVREAAGLFGLLASTTRLHIVWLLAHGEQDVGALAEAVGGALPAVSQHLAKLKLAGLVAARREGRRQIYLLADPRVADAVCYLVDSFAAPATPDRRRA